MAAELDVHTLTPRVTQATTALTGAHAGAFFCTAVCDTEGPSLVTKHQRIEETRRQARDELERRVREQTADRRVRRDR